ncbi:hypothetical protein QYE77_12180 [Thermanaerothrix sp. 4228-RoL]|jgi:hypothetical protein|uniref:3-keto-disaccharide hydrolase domain-containing protein n=1 Tax=Thermanaerothrix solaris TaxID=3058434 RepID=A0ABU3NQB6_9CHLR|nr:hypothetical protein [Thermanaerothrix sp. 4228-RoL]MDT8899023.1 hypothetical protein [Thermanaerothrix sp. 4228-RoL]
MLKPGSLWVLLVGLVVLGLPALACGLPGQVAPTATRQVEILFQDDFSDPDSGWDRRQDSDGVTDYTGDGAYRIRVDTPNLEVWANPGRNFKDVQIEVDATKVAGPDDNDFGVLCRYVDTQNFYFFLISSDGYFGIGKKVNGETQVIGAENLESHTAIRQGTTTNHIRADCVGNTLSLHVNGTLLRTVNDEALKEGDVGLIAGAYAEPGVEIFFDNFMVYKP